MERTQFIGWNTRYVLRGTHGMSCMEDKKRPAWNTRDVLPGTHEMSCLEYTRCPAWTQEMSCVEHTERLAWNTRDVPLGTQEMSPSRALEKKSKDFEKSSEMKSDSKPSFEALDSALGDDKKLPKYFYEIQFEKPGGLVMPIIVDYSYEDGTKERYKYPNCSN